MPRALFQRAELQRRGFHETDGLQLLLDHLDLEFVDVQCALLHCLAQGTFPLSSCPARHHFDRALAFRADPGAKEKFAKTDGLTVFAALIQSVGISESVFDCGEYS